MEPAAESGTFQSLPAMFFARAARWADRPRYRVHRDDAWTEVDWRTMEQSVREIAAGLVSLGIERGDRIAIFAATSPEWVEIDLAIQAAGGVTIPIYHSNLASEAGFILLDSESRMVWVDGDKTVTKVREALASGVELEGGVAPLRLDRILVLHGEAVGAEDTLGVAELRRRGRDDRAAQEEVQRRVAALRRDHLATIVYTSGTTGAPKGVVQTQGNHLAMIENTAALGVVREGEVDFFFLPLAHSFARMIAYYGLYVGSVTAFARSIDTLSQDIAATKPNVIPAVPRIYEKIHARIHATRDAGSALTQKIFDWALEVGKQRSTYQQAGESVPLWIQVQNVVARKLVFERVQHLLGGNVRVMISGASPIAREILEFFHAFELLILEGYGLTETTPALTINRADDYKFGTVGKPIPGCQITIAPDGEIFARGPNVALGYYKRPHETAEAWDDNGWFHTGDIGEFDSEGFLRITDRKKDLIKTSGGKYVAPQKIENLLKTQPHISQAIVIGNNRKYCTALISLDEDSARSFRERHGIGPGERLDRNPEVLQLVEAEVADVNRKLASFETIKFFRVLPAELSEAAGELTPSLKIKRKVVEARYGDLIEEMYG
ncbi:long-chain fatty acid--CoA ligase [Candidatus Binatia bacterium]|nr:long-chain fatty acid--CoA ligase [Candidatus Binatia bacterium]